MNSTANDKKKIVVLENGLISTYTVREGLMKELLHQGFEVYVLTHSNKFQNEVEQMGIKVIDVGSGNTNPTKIFSYIHKVYTHLRAIRPDICLTFSVRPAIWGNLISRLLRIPVITNVSGTGPLLSSNNVAYRFIRFMYPIALRKTRRVFFQNEDDRGLFISHNFVAPERAGLIPGSGVDGEKFSPQHERKGYGQNFSFLFIGRLIKDKGIFEFVEAAKKIKQKHTGITFRVIGPLWKQNLKSNSLSEENIQQWISDGTIEYLGEKKDVFEDIAQADCVVLPSYREGLSNVLLESSAMEVPCIATDVTGCRDVIDHEITGLLCNVRDAEDLALKMERMYYLNPFQRLEMGQKARQKVTKEFDKKIVIAKYVEEINAALSPSVVTMKHKSILRQMDERNVASLAANR